MMAEGFAVVADNTERFLIVHQTATRGRVVAVARDWHDANMIVTLLNKTLPQPPDDITDTFEWQAAQARHDEALAARDDNPFGYNPDEPF